MNDFVRFLVGAIIGFSLAMEMVQDHHACPPDSHHTMSYVTTGRCPHE